MFDKYVIVPDSLRNDPGEGTASSYSIDLRIPYYRGLGLSMVNVWLTVDNEEVPSSEITFTVHGHSYPVQQLPDVVNDRWPFTEPATLTVARSGGLREGAHDVKAKVHLRVSYAPNGFGAEDSKTLIVGGWHE